MVKPDKRHTADGLKRLIAFADAVVAIALTLLVLPLVDLASEVETRRTLPEIMSDHGDVLIGFLISFIVTWVLWRNHHAIMENYYDRKVSVPKTGPIQLQTHGGEIRWRNISRGIPPFAASMRRTSPRTRTTC